MKKGSRQARQEALRQQKQKQRVIWGVGITGVLLLIFSAVMALRAQSIPSTNPADSEAIALGRQVYETQCASCHGVNLEGQAGWKEPNPDGSFRAPPHDETGHTWHHPDAQLFAITKHGTAALVGGDYKTRMEGFGDSLTDAEILAILAYVKSTWPPQIIARHNQVNAAQP